LTDNPRLKPAGEQSREILLFVKGLEFYAYHGVPESERQVGHRYEIDLELTVRTDTTETDDVSDSVDYGDVATTAARFGQETQFRTVERLAQGIIDVLFSKYKRVDGIRIRLAKRLPPAPIMAASAGIEMFRRRGSDGTPG